ncbi:WD40-repeat-containing domain protein, partial [Phyllosticta citrichinensis]
PYLASHERQSLQSGLNEGTWEEEVLKNWRGISVHIGLNPQELLKLEGIIADILGKSPSDLTQSQARGRIEALMKDTAEADVFKIAAIASQRKALPDRTKESIEAALRDAQDGCLLNTKTTLSEGRPTAPSITSIVRQRELRLGRNLGVPATMKTMILDTIGPSMSFTGTSNDVNTVAWAPNGVNFAAGSACHVDSDSMQYNRPNNLLFGSTHERTLLELPEHHTLRERPASGPNSSNAMHVTQDRRLFQTVAAVCFSPDGKSMYSAGYDGMLRMWDIKESGARQRLKMFRNAKTDLLAVSKNGLLATGAQRTTTNAITVFDPNQSGDLERWSISGFNSRRAAQRPENKIYPSTIRFDPHAGKYLLAGFASTSREELTCGESCLWDLRSGTQLHLFPETRNVFDVAWNPSRSSHLPDFAVGCVAGSNVNRGVRSVVKMYDIRSREKCGMSMELDCPALDMNDVMWCPYDENLLVAGCTNGKTCVWDVRQAHPEIPLYSLEHDQPLMELADPESRERLDTGIRFCSWGHSKNRFYTGSSDGVVKSWDLYRSREDALVRNVVQLNSGVMCGSFSPDYTSLLLGEVNGTINVLEVGKEEQSIRDMDSFNLKPASSPPKRPPGDDNSTSGDDSGVAASKTLMQTGQIILAPVGGFPVRQALQGPAYAGPFDSAMDAEDLRDKAAVFQENLASANDEQCKIEGCIVDCVDEDAEPIHKFTEEECGDSGRWKDRIPAALTLRAKLTDTDVENIPKQRSLLGVTPSLKCSAEGCDRPVRLRPDD